jgi:hypothetical protein
MLKFVIPLVADVIKTAQISATAIILTNREAINYLMQLLFKKKTFWSHTLLVTRRQSHKPNLLNPHPLTQI